MLTHFLLGAVIGFTVSMLTPAWSFLSRILLIIPLSIGGSLLLSNCQSKVSKEHQQEQRQETKGIVNE